MNALDDESLVRELESTVLDNRHREFPLLQRSQETAVIHLLKVYCDISRYFRDASLSKYSLDSLRTVAITITCGLEYALKWALRECESSTKQPSESWLILDNEAQQLLDWGKTYGLICSDHIAWSRGLLAVSVNQELKTVTFEHNSEIDIKNHVGQFRSDSLVENELSASVPKELLDKVYFNWCAASDLSKPHLLPDPTEFLQSDRKNIVEMREWAANHVLPELDGNTALGKFTLDDYRSVYGPLFGVCQLYAKFEHDADDNGRDVGSFILNDSSEAFSQYLARLGDIDTHKAQEIIALLTFDPKNRRSKLVSQPFVLTKKRHLCLSARLLASQPPYQVITGALLASNKRCYESIVEKLEHRSVKSLASVFRSFGFEVKTHASIRLADGKIITPDFLIRESRSNRILVADYKHIAPARYVGEIANKIVENKKWVKQVQRYRRELRADDSAVRKVFPAIVTANQIEAAIIYRWPLPLPIKPENDVTFMDSITMHAIRRGSETIRLSDLLEYFRGSRNGCVTEEFRSDFVDLVVGDWTYRHPVFVA